MQIVRHDEQRRTETPNGVMTTLASPTLGGAGVSVWRVAMAPGRSGPVHSFDGEQVWTVTAGSAIVEAAGERATLEPGDTVVLPADVERRVTAGADAGLEALVTSGAGVRARLPDGTDRGVPPWIA